MKTGLNSIGNISSLLESDEPVSTGQPLMLQIDLIHDDPENREEVPQAFLEELAADIRLVGVKSPISVRKHPEIDGHFMVNFGHNRKASSIIAGKSVIPAFIDESFTDFDRVKENIKRLSQHPRDNAKFIDRKLKQGLKKGEIAEKLGMSAAWISQHVTLLSLPPTLDMAFRFGRCEDVTLINELAKLYKKHPEDVETWLADENQDITRGSVKLLAEFIEQKSASTDDDTIDEPGEEDEEPTTSKDEKKATEKDDDPTKLKKAIVIVEYMGQSAQLNMKKRPSMTDNGWIKLDSDGEELEVPLAQLKILELIEG